MVGISVGLKESLKANPVYPIYRALKLKWNNYFAQYGELYRHTNHLLARFDPRLRAGIRKRIAEKLAAKASSETLDFVNEIKLNGFSNTKFSSLNIDAEKCFEHIQGIILAFKKDEDNYAVINSLDSGKYAGKALSYHLYDKTEVLASDPFMKLALHPKLIEIAAIYLGYLPILDFNCVVFTPRHDGGEFGAQLWHKDLHHKNSLKLFFSPEELDISQGPFEYFHPKDSTYKYYKHAPQSMTDEQLLNAGLDPKTSYKLKGGYDSVLFVDTARCLHRGGKTQRPRYIATFAYCSPLHSFTPSGFAKTDHYDLEFVKQIGENNYLMEKYKRI